MDQGLIPKRYSKALYEVALASGSETSLYDQMRMLSAAFDSEPRLAATMENPFVSDADKAALIYTASGTNDTVKPMADFVRLLQKNNRMGLTRQIAIAYEDLYRRLKNIYRVKVVSAAPLSDAEQDRLKKLILAQLNGGTMEYTSAVDPDLIGGFTVTIDNQRLDASVKNELKQLRLNLLSNKQ